MTRPEIDKPEIELIALSSSLQILYRNQSNVAALSAACFSRARVRHPMVRDKPMDAQIYHQFAKRPLANHSSELTKRDAPCFIRTSLKQFEKRLDELKEHDITNTRSSQRWISE